MRQREQSNEYTGELKKAGLESIIGAGKLAVDMIFELGYDIKTFTTANRVLRLEEGHYSDDDKLTFVEVASNDVEDCLQITTREWDYGRCLSTRVNAGLCDELPYLYAEQVTSDGNTYDGIARVFSGDRQTDKLGIHEVQRVVSMVERAQRQSSKNI